MIRQTNSTSFVLLLIEASAADNQGKSANFVEGGQKLQPWVWHDLSIDCTTVMCVCGMKDARVCRHVKMCVWPPRAATSSIRRRWSPCRRMYIYSIYISKSCRCHLCACARRDGRLLLFAMLRPTHDDRARTQQIQHITVCNMFPPYGAVCVYVANRDFILINFPSCGCLPVR